MAASHLTKVGTGAPKGQQAGKAIGANQKQMEECLRAYQVN